MGILTEQATKAAKFAEHYGLPILTGSEEQIALAEIIRAKVLKTLIEIDRNILEDPTPEAVRINLEIIRPRIANAMVAQESAGDWLE